MNIQQKINSWVSRQAPWVDDACHFSLGFTGCIVVFLLLNRFWPQGNTWIVRGLALVIPVIVGAWEESTNIHPDYWHDVPGYVVGALACSILLPSLSCVR